MYNKVNMRCSCLQLFLLLSTLILHTSLYTAHYFIISICTPFFLLRCIHSSTYTVLLLAVYNLQSFILFSLSDKTVFILNSLILSFRLTFTEFIQVFIPSVILKTTCRFISPTNSSNISTAFPIYL